MNDPLVVAVTGASGVAYTVRLLQILADTDRPIELTISPSGQTVLKQELGIEINLQQFQIKQLVGAEVPIGNFHYYHYQDFMAPMASGSHLTGGMVICPCSGSTLSAIAHATGGNLIQRAADVHLKEGRRLILVPRETPLSSLQLENMHRVSQAGAVMLPASPGWYHGVRSVQDLIDFVVARILDQLRIPHRLMQRWGDPADQAEMD